MIAIKIFKNRGEIYFSKADYKRSKEGSILIALLILIIIVTAVFFVVLNNKYDSAKDFFGRGEITTTQVNEQNIQKLPSISGKTNFLVFETDEDESNIHYIFLIQADSDSVSYKVCALSPKMTIDNESIYDIYSQGGGASLQTKMTAYFGINIDYYVAFKEESFIEFVNKFGSVTYPNESPIRFSSEFKNDNYNVRIGKGNVDIRASDISNLLRYYSNDNVDYKKANEIILFGITQLFNSDNFKDNESLFRLFVNSASTNITVRNFQDNINSLYVFCEKNEKVEVYSVNSSYENQGKISQKTVSEIKGYFSE